MNGIFGSKRGMIEECEAMSPHTVEIHIPAQMPGDRLRSAADLFDQKNAEYGANYKQFGDAFLSLFPKGRFPVIESAEDANRLHLVVMALGKLQRYCHRWNDPRGATAMDSLRDLQVYAAILENVSDESSQPR